MMPQAPVSIRNPNAPPSAETRRSIAEADVLESIKSVKKSVLGFGLITVTVQSGMITGLDITYKRRYRDEEPCTPLM